MPPRMTDLSGLCYSIAKDNASTERQRDKHKLYGKREHEDEERERSHVEGDQHLAAQPLRPFQAFSAAGLFHILES